MTWASQPAIQAVRLILLAMLATSVVVKQPIVYQEQQLSRATEKRSPHTIHNHTKNAQLYTKETKVHHNVDWIGDLWKNNIMFTIKSTLINALGSGLHWVNMRFCVSLSYDIILLILWDCNFFIIIVIVNQGFNFMTLYFLLMIFFYRNLVTCFKYTTGQNDWA